MNMERIRAQVTTPVLVGAGAGLVLGLIIGLIFGWGIWPVQWDNAAIEHLRDDLQRDYLVMTIQTFGQTGDAQEAQRRWNEMGENRNDVLASITTNPPPDLSATAVGQFAAIVQPGAAVPQPPAEGGQQPAQPVVGEEAAGPNWLTMLLVVMCLITLITGGILAYLFVFRNRTPAIVGNRGPVAAVGGTGYPLEMAPDEDGQAPPIVQYLTTYNLGNDLYDDSFSIDSPNGEFLGECGVGISETIGVGDPKKVTAFEVWLFDKNDIQTVTKVLMSQHAYNEPSINQRLASKGEPVLAEPGKHIVLETATLQLEARVVSMNYGQGALPGSSFFEQMTLELAVWPKQ
jgi:hypothetical protein